jgi:uncharacterized membrane protein
MVRVGEKIMDIAYSGAHKRCDQSAANLADPFEASCYPTKVAHDSLNELDFYGVIKACTAGAAINWAVPSAAFAPVVRAMDHSSCYANTCTDFGAKIWDYLTQTSGFKHFWNFTGGMLTSLGFFLFFLMDRWSAWSEKFRFQQSNISFFILTIACCLAINRPIIGSKFRLLIKAVITVFVVQAVQRSMKSRAVA